MAWLIIVGLLAVGAALVLTIFLHRRRFERRVEEEMRALTATPPSSMPFSTSAELPRPVARYRELAVGERTPVRTLKMLHGGTFCMTPAAKPAAIRGTQLFTSDPPGFVWTGRIPMAPGLWVDARDMAVAGRGSMRVLLDDTVTLADAHGPQLDQGSALRLLAEMAWYPTAFFDERFVTWAAIDESHARATLRVGACEVSGIFEFGPDGLPSRIRAERYMDKVGLRPWSGTYRSYRRVSTMLVPFEVEVSWELDTGTFTYARWHVDALEYDPSVAHVSLRTAA